MRLLFFSLLFASTAFAEDVTCTALVRNGKHSLVEKKVSLPHITSDDSFTGRYFKIVESKNNEAIKLNDKNLSLRACTVYYHLSKARQYFLDEFQDRHVRNLRQLTIRIEMPYSFIDSSHFMDEKFKSYNNSLTIPPSGRNRVSEVEPWDYEVWFAPKKSIKKKNAVEQASRLLNSPAAQENLRLGVFTGVGSLMATQFAQGVTLTSLEGRMYVQSLVVSMLAVTVTPWAIEKTSSLVKQSLYLDTALIPEVIYHEYAHVALARYLRPSHHSSIIEGMANFFAADIGKTNAILKKTKGLSKGLDKVDAKKKIMFDSWMEDQSYAQYGFTFGLLYDVQQALGSADGRDVIYRAHQKLSASSSVRHDLPRAIEEAIKEKFPVSEHKKLLMKLSLVWQNRGL